MKKSEHFPGEGGEVPVQGGGLYREGQPGPCLDGGGPCMVRSNASWVMVPHN